MSTNVPIDEQCQYHSEVKGRLHNTHIIKCDFKAVATNENGKRMCKMHRRHYDNRARKLNLPLSIDIEA